MWPFDDKETNKKMTDEKEIKTIKTQKDLEGLAKLEMPIEIHTNWDNKEKINRSNVNIGIFLKRMGSFIEVVCPVISSIEKDIQIQIYYVGEKITSLLREDLYFSIEKESEEYLEYKKLLDEYFSVRK